MHKIAIDLDITVILPLLAVALILLGKSVRTVWCREDHLSAIALPAIWTSLFAAFFFASDSIKVTLGAGVYEVMAIAGIITFLIALGCACFGAGRLKYSPPNRALELIMYAAFMLFAAGGTVHFIHQAENAKHVLCPRCDDSDSDN